LISFTRLQQSGEESAGTTETRHHISPYWLGFSRECLIFRFHVCPYICINHMTCRSCALTAMHLCGAADGPRFESHLHLWKERSLQSDRVIGCRYICASWSLTSVACLCMYVYSAVLNSQVLSCKPRTVTSHFHTKHTHFRDLRTRRLVNSRHTISFRKECRTSIAMC
jgi:hypothetical protein